MLGPIFLDIVTGALRSTSELRLSRDDVAELFESEFSNVCPVCRGEMGNSAGNICCECLKDEMKLHTDCCLEGIKV